jgi:glycerophosphoryl diester phosphodiesterase
LLQAFVLLFYIVVSLTSTQYHYSAKRFLVRSSFLLLVSVALLCACAPGKKSNATTSPQLQDSLYNTLRMTSAIDFQGHRGCRGLLPENTIPAMLQALSLGVTTLEMDVVFTKDSVAILSHEPFFNHEISSVHVINYGTSYQPIPEAKEKDYNIYKMTFAQTQEFDVGIQPHPRFPQQQKMAVTKPSLAALFDSVRDYMLTRRRPYPYFNIETKTTAATDNTFHPAPKQFVDMLMKVIQEKQMEDFVTIQSFDIRTLQYLHSQYPKMAASLLIEDYDKHSFKEQLDKLGFTPTVYSPHYSLVTEQLVKNCHAQKIKIIPWTVNDKAEMQRLIALGVDGIISDYPNLFQEIK